MGRAHGAGISDPPLQTVGSLQGAYSPPPKWPPGQGGSPEARDGHSDHWGPMGGEGSFPHPTHSNIWLLGELFLPQPTHSLGADGGTSPDG